jgi:hypothetical protein
MQKPEVRAFKNELRNYAYYCSRIASLEESIEFMYDKLGGVRGIDPSKEPLHTQPSKEFEYMVRDKITDLEKNKALYEAKRDYIDLILRKMETSVRGAVIAVYVKQEKCIKVADQNFLSSTGLQKRMNRAIEVALL